MSPLWISSHLLKYCRFVKISVLITVKFIPATDTAIIRAASAVYFPLIATRKA